VYGRELCGSLCGSHAHGHGKHATPTAVLVIWVQRPLFWHPRHGEWDVVGPGAASLVGHECGKFFSELQ
jgi:hypothetical protein